MLAILSEIDLSRLVSTSKENQQVDTGVEMYGNGQVTKQVSIIENGVADVYTREDLSELTLDEIDKAIGTPSVHTYSSLFTHVYVLRHLASPRIQEGPQLQVQADCRHVFCLYID